MKTSTRLTIAKPDFNTQVGLFFSILIIFLQAGFSYYLSVQALALVFVVTIIFASKPSLVNSKHLLLVFLLLSFSMGITAVFSPTVISRNSPNIFLTLVATLTYSLLIICLPNLILKRAGLILFLFKYASAATVVLLACLIVLTDSPWFPFLDRELLFLQNSTLITNFVDRDAAISDLAYKAMHDLEPRIDLFYGEPSYLATVVFSCVVCYMLTSRLISGFNYHNGNEPSYLKSFSSRKYHNYVVITGIISLLYIQSLSSIIYALLIFFYEFRTLISNRLTPSKLLAFIVFAVLIALVFLDSYEYLLFRIHSMQDSLSLFQRFGTLFDFNIEDYLFGLKEVSRMPKEGFHNGLFYIIAISGAAGIYFLVFLLRTVYLLAKPVKMSPLLSLSILALIVQNGAVFSPNKVVLFSLILLPLSCARTIYARKTFDLTREILK